MAALLPLLAGCFSTIVSRNIIGSKSDWFSPTALYKSKADGSLAVEGTLTKAGEQNGVPAYLVIPQEVLVAAHLQTKGNRYVQRHYRLAAACAPGTVLAEEVKLGLRKNRHRSNQGGMDVNRGATVNIKAIGLLPFAFVVDAVTFPLQICIGKKMSESPIQ